jgi:hypothetical protein
VDEHVHPEVPTDEELQRVLQRGFEARRLLCERIAMLEGERAELLAIISEMQRDLLVSRAQGAEYARQLSGERLSNTNSTQPIPQ